MFFAAGDHIPCVGVQLGLVVADTWAHARAAAKLVKQAYGEHGPVAASLDAARAAGKMATDEDVAHGRPPMPLPPFFFTIAPFPTRFRTAHFFESDVGAGVSVLSSKYVGRRAAGPVVAHGSGVRCDESSMAYCIPHNACLIALEL